LPTGLKIIDVFVSRLSQHKLYAFERHAVMSDLAHDPISGTSDRHVCGLQRSVVSRGKPSVRREAGKSGVRKVASDQSSHIVQFLLGRFVFPGIFICQQFRPTHSELLSQSASSLSRL
jgi:hypothetical protein